MCAIWGCVQVINDVNISYGIKGGAVCAAILVAGCADVEHVFSDRDMDRFVTAMISVDCKVDASNHETVEKATGFSTDKLTEITDYLN
jgi:hypothetical protein